MTPFEEKRDALLAALDDERPYEVRDIANRMNLPVFAKQPEPLLSTTTMGMRARELLYELVTPIVEPKPIKVFSEQILEISDWRAFFEQRKSLTLEQIHAELRPLVVKYWDQHGTTQKVL